MSSTHPAERGDAVVDPLAALAVPLATATGWRSVCPGDDWNSSTFSPGSHFLPWSRDQPRLVVERVALAGRAGHEQLHDALGLGREVQPAVAAARARTPGTGAADSSPSRPSSDASAIPPSPPPELPEEPRGREKVRGHRRLRSGSWQHLSWDTIRVQSTNTNSLMLKIIRQASARPVLWRPRPVALVPPRRRGRPKARRKAASIWSASVGPARFRPAPRSARPCAP